MRLRRLRSAAASAAILLSAVIGLGACRNSTGSDGGTPASVEVTPDSVSLHLFATQQLTVAVLNPRGRLISGTPVTYSVADTTVASVSATGLVTAKQAGKTTLTASSGRARRTIPVVVLRDPVGRFITSRTIPGTCPHGVAVSAAGFAYVTNICGSNILRLEVPSLALGAAVAVGSAPAHVAIDPAANTAYVADQLSATVSVVSVATNTTVATIRFGGFNAAYNLFVEAYNLIVSKDGSRVYASTNTGMVLVIDAATRSIVDSMPAGRGANGLAFHPTEPILYVSSVREGTVTAFSTQTRAVMRTYNVGGRAQRIAVSPNGAELYIANEDHGLQILDLSNGAVTAVPIGGAGIGLAMPPEGDYVYVAVAGGGKVAVYETGARTIYRTILVGSDPRNMAVATDASLVIADQAGVVHVLR